MLRQPAEQSLEVAGPASEEDVTIVIEEELQATDLGNLETDINSLDADIISYRKHSPLFYFLL